MKPIRKEELLELYVKASKLLMDIEKEIGLLKVMAGISKGRT